MSKYHISLNYNWTQYNKRQHTDGRVSVQFIKLVRESTIARKTNANIHNTTKAHTQRYINRNRQKVAHIKTAIMTKAHIIRY